MVQLLTCGLLDVYLLNFFMGSQFFLEKMRFAAFIDMRQYLFFTRGKIMKGNVDK